MKRYALGLLFAFAASMLLIAGFRGAETYSAAAAENWLVFLPVISKPLSQDLLVDRIEISQAVQRIDNSVPLVANRATVVRVYAQHLVGSGTVQSTVSLSAYRNNVFIGRITSPSATIPRNPDRANYSSTFNFTVPGSWLSGTVRFVAQVDPNNALPEISESNNLVSQTVQFTQIPSLNITIVPVNYQHQGNFSGFYPGQTSDVSGWIRRAFPVNNVNVTFHPTGYTFTGNLEIGSEWERLLNEVTSLKLAEKGSGHPTVYYGLVPVSSGSSRWFWGGVAGIGWIGWNRVSVGLNLPTSFGAEAKLTLAAHEIAHNLGRRHAPCGVSQSDPNYPYLEPLYPNASIGEFGLDISGSSVSLRNPAQYVDFMSYCDPEWISDYTYEGLFQDQLVNGFAVSSEKKNGLLVRAAIDASGNIEIEPVYALTGVALSEIRPSDQWLELTSQSGELLGRYPAHWLEAEEPGVSARGLFAVLPLPDQPVGRVVLTEGGAAIAQRQMTPIKESQQRAAVATIDGQQMLTWEAAGLPALVRFTADDGASWTALGIDLKSGQLELGEMLAALGPGRIEVVFADQTASDAQVVELK